MEESATMNDIIADPRLTIGANNPPATIADELALAHVDDLKLREELLKSLQTAPARIDDDETQNKASELIKKTRTLEIRFEKGLDAAKAPHEEKVRAIRGFFKTQIETLEKLRKALAVKSEDYMQRKAEAEKRRLREEEDARREAAAKALKLAQDAEQARNAKQASAQEAARLAQEATEARAAATSEQETAAADLALARAEHAKLKAEIFAFAAVIAERAKEGNPVPDEEKAARKTEFEAGTAALRAKVDAADSVLKAARQRAIEAKREADRLEEERAAEARAARAADREAQASLKDAVREERAADRIATKIDGPDADLARTRSVHGAVSTLARQWKCEVIDRDALDKNALWAFINGDAIQAALWKWMMAQSEDKRVMPGARIEQETVGQVR